MRHATCDMRRGKHQCSSRSGGEHLYFSQRSSLDTKLPTQPELTATIHNSIGRGLPVDCLRFSRLLGAGQPHNIIPKWTTSLGTSQSSNQMGLRSFRKDRHANRLRLQAMVYNVLVSISGWRHFVSVFPFLTPSCSMTYVLGHFQGCPQIKHNTFTLMQPTKDQVVPVHNALILSAWLGLQLPLCNSLLYPLGRRASVVNISFALCIRSLPAALVLPLSKMAGGSYRLPA